MSVKWGSNERNRPCTNQEDIEKNEGIRNRCEKQKLNKQFKQKSDQLYRNTAYKR